jgi:hypothetical protein
MTLKNWLILIALAAIYCVIAYAVLSAGGCGNPCDSRPGYEHPDAHPMQKTPFH